METTLDQKTWAIDQAHSHIQFKVKHMMVSTVMGTFDDFDGKVVAEGKGFDNASISFVAQTASISTKNTDRDNHLKSEDFFDADTFPQITFASTAFKKTQDDAYLLTGDLTIRGITKAVTLAVIHEGTAVDPYGQTKAGFEISGKINRSDFGLKWNAVTEAGSIVVGDKVNLAISVQLLQK